MGPETDRVNPVTETEDTLMRKDKRCRGDRYDGRWLKNEIPGLQSIMVNLWPNRTDCEVCVFDELDVTDMLKFIESKNLAHPEYKTTVFHCYLLAVARMIRERPKMNRFISGRRFYERKHISLSFVAKRRFADHSDEALLVFIPDDSETIDSFSHKISGEVSEVRKNEIATGGVDHMMDSLARLPRLLLMLITRIVRILDFWGINPKAIRNGDPNYTTVLASNLGSIKAPSVYHHLSNYGTLSILTTLGAIHKKEVLMDDGTTQVRDVVDFSATLDERIADGFYFARSLKLVQYVFAHPEILDQPLSVPSGCDLG